jgi:hypothetical protein
MSRVQADYELLWRDDVPGGEVVTAFLGVDSGRPTIGRGRFETKAFGGPLDGRTWRYDSHDEAKAGHAHVVRLALNSEGAPD